MNELTIEKNNLAMTQVETVHKITRKEFHNDFVNKGRPVILKGYMSKWSALKWNTDYFKANECGQKLAVKTGNVSKGEREYMLLSEYGERLQIHQAELLKGNTPPNPGYLHDVPFFHVFPDLVKDVDPFPLELFPRWYWHNWHNYIQFFMGAKGSLTPLHFDTLLTHNLFFQVVGQKKFILIPSEQRDLCYMKSWRWAALNPDKPDFEKHPLAKDVTPSVGVIGPDDILYIPPGVLHQVHGLSFSISFNMDWHTSKSALDGMMSIFKGAPRKNFQYNFLSFLGLGLKVPPKYLFPYYKSYLNYVS